MKAHWDNVYALKAEDEVSWYTSDPRLSLDRIAGVAPTKDRRIIDVGGGASVLVDRLLDRGHENLAVLDLSGVALERAKHRLGQRASRVRWIIADVTIVENLGQFDVWHDRAVFHFLTDSEDRKRYARLAANTVPPGGHLVIGTFALDGPPRCSGLEVRRYDADSIAAEFASDFRLVGHGRETHTTPSGKPQAFLFTVFARK